MSPFTALIIMSALSGAAIGTFALLVIGIRKGDRGHLSKAPRTPSDAIARRCLTSVRTDDREAR